jgi:hypothetical protein
MGAVQKILKLNGSGEMKQIYANLRYYCQPQFLTFPYTDYSHNSV